MGVRADWNSTVGAAAGLWAESGGRKNRKEIHFFLKLFQMDFKFI